MSRKTQAIDDEMVSDADQPKVVEKDKLDQIVATATELIGINKTIAELSAQIGEKNKEALRLANEVLPNLLDEAGISDLGLSDDFRVKRSEEIYANISKENMSATVSWLEANNYADIVRYGILIPLGKGDVKMAKMAKVLLTKAKLGFEEIQTIHAQTLKAFVKESLASDPPRVLPKTIGVHIQPVAIIVAAKSSKKRSK